MWGLLALLAVVQGKDLFKGKSEVLNLNARNFKTQTEKGADDLTMVNFYAGYDGASKAMEEEYTKLSNSMHGIIQVAAINCEKQQDICKKAGVTTYPFVRLYAGMFKHDYKGEFLEKKMAKFGSKFVNNYSTKIEGRDLQDFTTKFPSMPKVILFSKQAKTALLWKALSVKFNEKLVLGEVNESETTIVERFRIKNYPTIMVLKPGEKKPFKYKGEMKFFPIFEFLNRYTETFTAGGAIEEDAGEASDDVFMGVSKWKNAAVPEVSEASFNEICLEAKGVCAIAFLETEGGKPKPDQFALLEGLSKRTDRKIKRGLSVRVMFVDVGQEAAFAAGFGVSTYPQMAILNPGKRKRYAMHEGEFVEADLNALLDKVVGGDIRYKKIELPQLKKGR